VDIQTVVSFQEPQWRSQISSESAPVRLADATIRISQAWRRSAAFDTKGTHGYIITARPSWNRTEETSKR